jgi:uncharacterized membrane protein
MKESVFIKATKTNIYFMIVGVIFSAVGWLAYFKGTKDRTS